MNTPAGQSARGALVAAFVIEAPPRIRRLLRNKLMTVTIKISVRGLTRTCWKCRQPTTIVVGLHPTATADRGALVTCYEERVLAAAAELLRSNGAARKAAGVKPRVSRTTEITELTNGCQHCDALQGNFFIYQEELPEVLDGDGLVGLDHLADADIPAEQWALLRSAESATR
jgi:hypothetical protein